MTSLQKAYGTMDSHGMEIDEEGQHELYHQLKLVGINSRDAGVKMRPKFHMMPHLARQNRLAGNSKFSNTVEDESFNNDTVRIMATSHTKEALPRLLCKHVLLSEFEAEELELLRTTRRNFHNTHGLCFIYA